MRNDPRSRLIRMIKRETDVRVLADTLEYVKVVVAYRKYIARIAKNPPTPEVWVRLPRWKQVQIVLICEYYYRLHQVKTWINDTIGKVFHYG